MSDLVGSKLGDYEIKSLLATGGMAKVYRAFDVELEREVAVKVLTKELVEQDPTLAERFQREARAIANLEHPNIIPVYRSGEEQGLQYMAMKIIEGEDFADEIRSFYKKKKLMSPERMIFVLQQVASALDFAHASGVIHRDVKPSNILINKDGRAVLSDFGLVLRLEVDQTLGTAFGTPRYISPEQAVSSEDVVPQSDIYSLAVIVFEILTGQMLFAGDNPMQVALSHISEEPPKPRDINPNIPEGVETELLKALEKEPTKRHQTAGELIKAIKTAYGDTIDQIPDTVIPSLTSTTPIVKPVSHLSNTLTERLIDAGVPRKRARLVLFGIIVAIVVTITFVLFGLLDTTKDPVVLRYDGYTLVLQNQSSSTISIEDLVFTQVVGDGEDIVFETLNYWSTGNPSEVLSKECYAAWESPLAGEPVQPSKDEYGCDEWKSFIATRRFFWINQSEEGTNTFTITRGADLLATCDTAEYESYKKLSCSFDLEP